MTMRTSMATGGGLHRLLAWFGRGMAQLQRMTTTVRDWRTTAPAMGVVQGGKVLASARSFRTGGRGVRPPTAMMAA